MASIGAPLGKRSLLLASVSPLLHHVNPTKASIVHVRFDLFIYRSRSFSALVTAHRVSPLQPKFSSFHGYGIGLQLTSFGTTTTATTADSGTEIRNLTKDVNIWPTMALSM
ncbi:hypothetical protein BZA77DRAFT_302009 [Pyronema omphalodes]|nr:hypothetical protein BZA77DRAFT_302009 [Pyronema omphalodes]